MCTHGLPGWFSGQESACQYRSPRRHGSIPGQGDPLEEEMASHSRILAWRIPWTEEPGGIQSMGSKRVEYSWAHTHSLTHIHPPSALLSQLFSFLFTLISVAFALKIISYNRALTVIQVNFYSPELSRGVLKCSDRKLRKARMIPP